MIGLPPRSGPWARSAGVGMDPYAVWVGCLPPGLAVAELTLFVRAHVAETDIMHITALPVVHNHRTHEAPQLTKPTRPGHHPQTRLPASRPAALPETFAETASLRNPRRQAA